MLAYKPKDDFLDLVVRVLVGQSVKMNLRVSLALHIRSGPRLVGFYQLFRNVCLDAQSQMSVALYRTGLSEVLRYEVVTAG
jgi:hypothetical protein